MMLLGKRVTIVDSTQKDQVGLEGEVTQDNRDTIAINTTQGEKLLVKHTLTLRCEGFIIEGKTLIGTHAQRNRK